MIFRNLHQTFRTPKGKIKRHSYVSSLFISQRTFMTFNITNVMKITKELRIDTESLASGIIVDSIKSPETIAAHKDGENFTADELEKIEEYKKLLIAARPKE